MNPAHYLLRTCTLGVLIILISPAAVSAQFTEIIDALGDGQGHVLESPDGIAIDGSGNVYVAGYKSCNVFKITPGGTITQIIDETGDGFSPLDLPKAIAVDHLGNVFVAGEASANAFKISPAGAITEIIDAGGDGLGARLRLPRGIAVNRAGDVFVSGRRSDNVFKITPNGGITQIIDATGDGRGNTLDGPSQVVASPAGIVYVAGRQSDNVFEITPAGTITEIIDATGDGEGNMLDGAERIAASESGHVYVAGTRSNNAFEVDPGGDITKIIDVLGDGHGNDMWSPRGIAVAPSGDVYVTCSGWGLSARIFCIRNGDVSAILDGAGPGQGKLLRFPQGIVADEAGNVYVSASSSDNAFVFARSAMASCTVRTGSGINPLGFDCVTNPVVGTTWESTIDLTPTIGSMAQFTAVVTGLGGPASGVFVMGGQELLVSPPLVTDTSVTGVHSIDVPFDASLIGVPVFTQGMRFESVLLMTPSGVSMTGERPVLLNALDLVLGL